MTTLEDVAVERAKMFKALGDPTRVRIFDFLRSRCCAVAVDEDGEVRPVQGPTFGEVCCHVTGREKITTTISFHLNILRDAGLISVEKQGRYMVCDVDREAVARLGRYLTEDPSPKETC